jgi:putative ATPase
MDYKYAHNFADGWVDQEYVPTDVVYYRPTNRGYEASIKARLEELRKRREKGEQKPSA